MKFAYLIISVLMLCSCYRRIGDLTLVSNQNYDSSAEYVLVARNVEGKSKARKGDPLESAIDNLVAEHKGNHLRNVKIFVKKNGEVIKVIGDVYADKKNAINVETSVNETIQLQIGDRVSFQYRFKLHEGKILGINKDGAVVEFKGNNDEMTKKQFSFEELTKLGK